MKKYMNPDTITGRVNIKAIELLEEHPEGMRWKDLLAGIRASDPTLHPKTVNGCVWRLAQNFPDKVCKPEKGVFQLVKYSM